MTSPLNPFQIDQCLPQIQCRQCGLPSCFDYAKSISRGESLINRCPPGGEITIKALSRLTANAIIPLDPECGAPRELCTAIIVEDHCIGCTLCIQACPVDAICGTAKQMHTVITAECTGCELCVEPCPVDCIDLESHTEASVGEPSPWSGYSARAVERARQRARARNQRLYQLSSDSQQSVPANREHLRQGIRESVKRVRERRNSARSGCSTS
ncbi:MAG TPA: RnfABCDGE type electron transport complex subunit B [Arenicellales bacterium]|nr:electron transporter RnfB [Acidiferrobacteraceae bacterium]MDP6135652.1 RnfABCDGE type electron transport complex subunit B [Arenicellales bacterium]HCF74335.1 electron transporter RnfB [Gammaproteobacteria bacterium]HJP10373.1 RnfABCDGE type electron transport complex subunit B [Arenicellales bacterium]|tara:strand:- start:33865 stop:34503 length:639 start_codon:yes stop_codon:yes gene_type:complete